MPTPQPPDITTPACFEEVVPATQRPASAGETIDLVPQILHLKNILVPIDFSETAEKALSYAMPFAEQFGAKLTLVHVGDLTSRPIEYGLYELNRADYNTAAQQQLAEIVRQRIPATLPEPPATAIRAGIPWLEICNIAKEMPADLIVLTTHGYTGLKRVFLGSTAERVVRHAPCPVLVVREKEHEFVDNEVREGRSRASRQSPAWQTARRK